jgi:hypothetical protein
MSVAHLPRADLTVHRARVRLPARRGESPSGPWVQAGIEDALRCASRPPGFAGHVVVVRRLRVRRRAGESSAALALRIEAAWHAVARTARHYGVAGTSDEAVWFADDGEARIALIEAWLDRHAPPPWYCAQLEAMLPPQGRAPVSAPLEVRIARAIAAPLDPPSARAGAEFMQAAFARVHAVSLLERVLGVWTEREAMHVLAQLGPPREPHLVFDPATELAETGRNRFAEPSEPAMPSVRVARWSVAHAALLGRATGARRTPNEDAAAGSHAPESAPALPMRQERRSDAPRRTAPHRDADPGIGTGVYTRWAGLLFLPALLERSGRASAFAAFGPDDAESAAATLLALAIQWLRIDEADPLPGALAPLLERASPLHRAFALAELRAAREWSVRALRLPLSRIARRRGRVIATATRVDAVFPLADADLRLRRAGIDVDPGWLPWLGWSLHFRFEGG